MKNQENVKATLAEIVCQCSSVIKSFDASNQSKEDMEMSYIHEKALKALKMGWPKEYSGFPD